MKTVIESTWLDMLAKHRPDLVALPRDQALALRNDPNLSRQMTDAYAGENAAGLPVSDGLQSVAHFAGLGGAKSVLQADPSTPFANVLPSASIKANPLLRNWNAGQLVDWSARKMGSTAPLITMPGTPARSGRFGFGGGETSAAPAPVAAMPLAAQPETLGGDYLSRLLAAVAGPSSAQAASAPAAPAALPSPISAGPQAPARFDARRFYALPQGRR